MHPAVHIIPCFMFSTASPCPRWVLCTIPPLLTLLGAPQSWGCAWKIPTKLPRKENPKKTKQGQFCACPAPLSPCTVWIPSVSGVPLLGDTNQRQEWSCCPNGVGMTDPAWSPNLCAPELLKLSRTPAAAECGEHLQQCHPPRLLCPGGPGGAGISS